MIVPKSIEDVQAVVQALGQQVAELKALTSASVSPEHSRAVSAALGPNPSSGALDAQRQLFEAERHSLESERRSFEQDLRALEAARQLLEQDRRGLEAQFNALNEQRRALNEEQRALESDRSALEAPATRKPSVKPDEGAEIYERAILHLERTIANQQHVIAKHEYRIGILVRALSSRES